MINIEKEIFQKVYTAVNTAYPSVFITGEYVNSPSSLPALYIIESENTTYTNGRDSEKVENQATLLYEIEVYSNKTTGKKTEAKNILNVADAVMLELGFTRTSLSPVPNYLDNTIYRITARYQAVVDTNLKIYSQY